MIVLRTDGIPLFLEELTRTVLESGLLREERDGFALTGPLQPLAIPTTLHASLLARLDRLAPVRTLAQVGAALGRQFSHDLIAAVVSLPHTQLLDALNQLVASELVFRSSSPPNAEYTFKHALVQDAAYSTLLRSQRRQLHGRIAATIERQFPDIVAGQPEVLARHCTEAGLSEAAIGWWRRAGELALRRSAFAEAIAHFDKAIGLTEGLADGPDSRLTQLRLQIAKGNSSIAAQGHHAHASTAAFARARELAAQLDDPPERLSAYYGVWVGNFTRAEIAQAQETAEAFLKVCHPTTRIARGWHCPSKLRDDSFFPRRFCGRPAPHRTCASDLRSRTRSRISFQVWSRLRHYGKELSRVCSVAPRRDRSELPRRGRGC